MWPLNKNSKYLMILDGHLTFIFHVRQSNHDSLFSFKNPFGVTYTPACHSDDIYFAPLCMEH